MKRKIILTVFVIAFSIPFLFTNSFAGTIMVGIKFWYAWWYSGYTENIFNRGNDIADGNIEQYFKVDKGATTADSNTDGDLELGRGFLSGPVLSYQTDDKLWSFSIAFMQLSRFTQKADATSEWTADFGGIPVSGTTDIKYEFTLQRDEIDLAIVRSLPMDFKCFIGLKQSIQTIEIKFIVVGSSDPPAEHRIELDIIAPTVGFGYAHAFSSWLLMGAQAGVLLIRPEMRYTDANGNQDAYIYEKSIGYNSELTLSALISERLILQLGYRCQAMQIKSYVKDVNEWDIFHGATALAVYLFDL